MSSEGAAHFPEVHLAADQAHAAPHSNLTILPLTGSKVKPAAAPYCQHRVLRAIIST